MSTAASLAWVLTYLAHSTVLLAGAWLVARSGRLRSLAAREWLWRAALVGGVLTASVQTFAGVRPWGGSIPLPERVVAVASTPATATRWAADATHDRDPAGGLGGRRERRADSASPFTPERARTGDGVRPDHGASSSRSGAAFLDRLRGATPALGLLALGLWLIALGLRARWALGRRVPVKDGPWADELARLVRAAGIRRRVRLSVSDRVATPVALGVLTPEICVPVRALEELRPDLARSALAHELAHLVRLDPLWLGLAHALRSLFFSQPLNRLAARELAHLAELSADEWAARTTGDGLALARCLTEVAGWLRPSAPPLGACPMVRRVGRLEERVRRLIDDSARRGGGARTPARRLPVLVAATALAVASSTLPGWTVPAPRAPETAVPVPREAREPARSWSAATRGLLELGVQVAGLEESLLELPPAETRDGRVRRAALTDRLRALRAEIDRLRFAAERGVAHPDSPDSPDNSGGPR